MAYMITHSLLSSWLYSISENPYDDATVEDHSQEDFLRTLRREPSETTEAMQNGIDFENLVTAICEGQEVRKLIMSGPCNPNNGEAMESYEYPKWYDAAVTVADIVKGGAFQYATSRTIQIEDMEILLYGRLDVLKAGTIFDIKFSKSYDRGKYFGSTQHPMYFAIVPESEEFTYVISNGTDVWTETYRREEATNIEYTVRDFLNWLKAVGLMDEYKKYWVARG